VASLPGGCMAIQLFQIDGLMGSLRSQAFGKWQETWWASPDGL